MVEIKNPWKVLIELIGTCFTVAIGFVVLKFTVAMPVIETLLLFLFVIQVEKRYWKERRVKLFGIEDEQVPGWKMYWLNTMIFLIAGISYFWMAMLVDMEISRGFDSLSPKAALQIGTGCFVVFLIMFFVGRNRIWKINMN